jgi:hypothetical protein
MKTSKLISVNGAGTWNAPDGKMLYKFEIETESGDVGTIFKMREDSGLSIGEDIDYEMINGKLKMAQKPFGEKGGSYSNKNGMSKEEWAEKDKQKSDKIAKAVALKEAVAFHTTEGGDINAVLNNAEIFYNWLTDGSKPAQSSQDLPF